MAIPGGILQNIFYKTVDDFINEVIEPNKLAFDGSGYLAWEGWMGCRKLANAPRTSGDCA